MRTVVAALGRTAAAGTEARSTLGALIVPSDHSRALDTPTSTLGHRLAIVIG
jgi:hypothetical protein